MSVTRTIVCRYFIDGTPPCINDLSEPAAKPIPSANHPANRRCRRVKAACCNFDEAPLNNSVELRSIATAPEERTLVLPIDPKLLEIIRCPVTKVSLYPLTSDQLEKLNRQISARQVQYADGSEVDQELADGLITATGTRIYRIDSGIPIMLEERCIPIQGVK